ncbi:hypothetical protein EDD11_008067 [Mortierella claussenii]|nr:hypothetical protein EDD11_008067 [Mortierella claussenii]
MPTSPHLDEDNAISIPKRLAPVDHPPRSTSSSSSPVLLTDAFISNPGPKTDDLEQGMGISYDNSSVPTHASVHAHDHNRSMMLSNVSPPSPRRSSSSSRITKAHPPSSLLTLSYFSHRPRRTSFFHHEDNDDDGETGSHDRFYQFRSSNGFLSFTVGLAIFVDLLCYGIIMPLTPFILQDLGLKSTANGGLIACYAVGLLIASPVAGVLSDRMANRRVPMIVGLIALLLSIVLFMESMKHFWILLVSRFCAGLAGGTMMTLGFALLSDTYPANQLGVEMGKIMIGQTLGMMAGPPLGGILQEHVGSKAPFVFCLILIVIDLGARLLIIERRSGRVKAIREFEKHHKQQPKRESQQEKPATIVSINPTLARTSTMTTTLAPTMAHENDPKVSTITSLLMNKRLITALFVSFLDAFLISALEPVLPLYLERRFHLSETQIGLTFLALSIPTVMSPLAGWFSDRHGAKIMSGIAIGFCAVFVVLLGLPNNPLWAIIALLVAIGATCSIYITPVLGEISAVVRVTGEGDGFARAFALFNMCFSFGMVLGPLLGSLVFEKTSMLWACVLISIVIMSILPFVFLFMGGKTQKGKDQEQYEKFILAEDMMLSHVEEQNRQQRL